MCVIVVKPKGKELPSENTLKACWRTNPDGAGFMYNNESGTVTICKGFMNFADFYSALEKVNNVQKKGVVMHFRIATSGLVDPGNCHPYPISSDEEALRSTFIDTTIGVAHNGIIATFNGQSKTLNDTQMYIKNVLSDVYRNNKLFYKDDSIMKLIELSIGSKMAFLTGRGDIYTIGDFKHTDTDDCLYSNLNHKVDYVYFGNNGKLFDDYGYNDFFFDEFYEEEVDKKSLTWLSDDEEIFGSEGVYYNDNDFDYAYNKYGEIYQMYKKDRDIISFIDTIE